MQLHTLKKALWTPNNVQNIGVIDNLQPKLLPFYRDELLHSRPTDCHQLKAIPSHIPIIMTSITWAGPRCVQELATILAPRNRIQGRCALIYYWSAFFRTPNKYKCVQ